MPYLKEVPDGYEVVYRQRLEDLEAPRRIRVEWHDRETGERRSRRLREWVRWVVMEDSGLFTLYDREGNQVEQFVGDCNAEVTALVPGFKADRVLKYAA
jgi:hypothetical protein